MRTSYNAALRVDVETKNKADEAMNYINWLFPPGDKIG